MTGYAGNGAVAWLDRYQDLFRLSRSKLIHAAGYCRLTFPDATDKSMATVILGANLVDEIDDLLANRCRRAPRRRAKRHRAASIDTAKPTGMVNSLSIPATVYGMVKVEVDVDTFG